VNIKENRLFHELFPPIIMEAMESHREAQNQGLSAPHVCATDAHKPVKDAEIMDDVDRIIIYGNDVSRPD